MNEMYLMPDPEQDEPTVDDDNPHGTPEEKE